MNGLAEILKLGPKLEAAWSGVDDFPRMASEALSRLEYTGDVDQLDRDMAEWLLTNAELPFQVNLHDTFGQPPVTVFNNGKFVVDLYFWVGADTSLHSHGFRGAFRVLHGQSLEETFEMRVRKVISHHVELTEPQPATIGFLLPGDVRTIGPGRELSHRVVHLENPTITLCVKTINEEALPQWHYFGGGLAVQRRHVPESLVKKVYYYQYLAGGPEAEAYLSRLIGGLDISMRLNLAEEVAGAAYDLHEETAADVLEAIYKLHQDELWFRLYEESSRKQRDEVDLMTVETAAERLRLHFANQGMLEDPRAKKLLEQLG